MLVYERVTLVEKPTKILSVIQVNENKTNIVESSSSEDAIAISEN